VPEDVWRWRAALECAGKIEGAVDPPTPEIGGRFKQLGKTASKDLRADFRSRARRGSYSQSSTHVNNGRLVLCIRKKDICAAVRMG